MSPCGRVEDVIFYAATLTPTINSAVQLEAFIAVGGPGIASTHRLIITQLNIYRHHLSTSSFPSFSLCRLSLSLCLLSLSSYSILKFYSFSFSFLIIYICCFLLRHPYQFVFSFSSVAFAILFSILNIFYNITFFPLPYSVADSWSTFGPGKRILPLKKTFRLLFFTLQYSTVQCTYVQYSVHSTININYSQNNFLSLYICNFSYASKEKGDCVGAGFGSDRKLYSSGKKIRIRNTVLLSLLLIFIPYIAVFRFSIYLSVIPTPLSFILSIHNECVGN